MFDSIMLWDKVLSDEDKFAMVDNDWSISEDMRTNDRFVERVIQMNASSMCDCLLYTSPSPRDRG